MAEPLEGPGELQRRAEGSARLMAGLIGASRLSGFVRLLVAVAVLGTRSPLSNVYSSANSIPTLVFEMLAAGALSATLLPEFRRRLASGERDELARLASGVLAWGGAVLAVVVGIGVVARRPIAGWLLSGIDDRASRTRAVDLMAVLIVCFLPQLFAYLVNTVAVAYLQAQHRFGASVLCPLVNNVVLIATYVTFWVMRSGAPPDLDLTDAQTAVLAGGTLLGVVLMCAVPAVDARRAGFSFARPLPARDPRLARVVRDGWWAALFLAGGQLVVAATLPITNARDGHGLVWMVAWQVFLLPHALLAVPVITARFPVMAAAHDEGDRGSLDSVTEAGARSVLATGLLAGGVMFGTAGPLGRLLALGASRDAAPLFTAAVRPLGAGVAAFGILHLMARRSYATGDTRTPAVVALVVAAIAVGGMYVVVDHVSSNQRLAVLGWSVAIANVVGAVALGRLVGGVRLDAAFGRRAAAAVAAGLASWGVARLAPSSGGVAVQGLVVAGAGAVGLATYLGVDRVGGGPPTRQVIASLGAAEASR